MSSSPRSRAHIHPIPDRLPPPIHRGVHRGHWGNHPCKDDDGNTRPYWRVPHPCRWYIQGHLPYECPQAPQDRRPRICRDANSHLYRTLTLPPLPQCPRGHTAWQQGRFGLVPKKLFLKQVRMSPGINKGQFQDCIILPSDEQPVRFQMAFPAPCILPLQPMRAITSRQRAFLL